MNTRKILLSLVVIFVFTSMSLFAVDFSYGIKGGVNLATFGGNDASFSGVYNSLLKVGFCVGVFGSVSFADIVVIQPAVLFTLNRRIYYNILM